MLSQDSAREKDATDGMVQEDSESPAPLVPLEVGSNTAPVSSKDEQSKQPDMPTRKSALNNKQMLALLRRWGLPGLLLIFFLQGLNINISTPFGEITVQTQHSLMQVISQWWAK